MAEPTSTARPRQHHPAGDAVPPRPGRRADASRSSTCPLRKDWAVLDGLNHIKDRRRRQPVLPLVVPDGHLRQLRHDGQRRAAGSPARRSSSTTRPGPIRVEPLANFPVIRDLVVDIDDFMRKLPQVKPWIMRDEEQAGLRGRVPADARAAGRLQAVQHVHQLHALLRRLPGLRAGPRLHRPGRDRAGPALQPRLPRRGRATSGSTSSSQHEGIWGCTFVGECTRVCPKHVDPAGAIQRYKLTAALRVAEGLRAAAGCAMTPERRRTRRSHPRYRRPMSTCWWLRKRSYFVVRAARAQQHLRRLVGGVPAPAGSGRRRRARPRTGDFLDWAGTPVGRGAQRRALAFLVLHAVTWFNLTPQAMVVQVRGPAVPAGRSRSAARMPAWVVVSALSSHWLVTR